MLQLEQYLGLRAHFLRNWDSAELLQQFRNAAVPQGGGGLVEDDEPESIDPVPSCQNFFNIVS
jgi:hypothetical protein